MPTHFIERKRERYAPGNAAWGQCERCGHRYYLNDLRYDPDKKIKVCTRGCWEKLHPQETQIAATDPIALEDPSPDRDSPGTETNTDLEYEAATTFPYTAKRP